MSSYRPINLCARAGDYVAFNDEGGFEPSFYPNGVPFQVFARAHGASTNFFTKDNGTNNGATFTGARQRGLELLMQMVVATGSNATPVCPRGHVSPRGFRGVAIRRQTAVVRNEGYTRIRSSCPRRTRGVCAGRMSLVSARGKPTRLGGTRFWLDPGKTRNVRVPLKSRAVRLVRRRGSIRASVRAVARDSIGRTRSTRATVRLKRASR